MLAGTQPSCGRVFVKELCNKLAHCEFDEAEFKCVGEHGTGVPGSSTPGPSTPGPTGSGECSELSDQIKCFNEKGCTWDVDKEACRRQGCADYFTAEECKLDSKCDMLGDDGDAVVCYEAGKWCVLVLWFTLGCCGGAVVVLWRGLWV